MWALDNIYLWEKENAFEDIIKKYKSQKYCIVNFLYFANVVSQKLLENWDSDYWKAIIDGDFLLPDGIALYLYYKKFFGKKIANLNWTDFLPYFVNNFKDADYIIYWSWEKANKWTYEYFINNYWIKPLYRNIGYDWKFVDLAKENIRFTNENRVLLVALGTPTQEIWIKNNIEFIKNNNLLVFSVWWLFDFLWWTEKRAPYAIRAIKLEWARRLITNPKKNYKKVLNSLIILKILLKNKN